MKYLKVHIRKHSFNVKVDNEDFKYLFAYTWYVDYKNENFSVYTRVKKEKVYLHRLLTNCPKNMVVDHIDGDGLNNQKKNLRICTIAENNMNVGKPKSKTCTSKYIGVSYDSRYVKPWKATISLRNKTVLIGNYKTEIEAAKARDRVAKDMRKNFARLNF